MEAQGVVASLEAVQTRSLTPLGTSVMVAPVLWEHSDRVRFPGPQPSLGGHLMAGSMVLTHGMKVRPFPSQPKFRSGEMASHSTVNREVIGSTPIS